MARTVTSPHRKRSEAAYRRTQEKRWARRSGTVFTYRVDPKQLRAEQLAARLAKEPEVFELLEPEMKSLLLAQLGASSVEPGKVE